MTKKAKLWADASGSQGQYNAGEVIYAVPILSPGSKQTYIAHKELVAKLIREGWEPTPSEDRSGSIPGSGVGFADSSR